LAFMSENAKQTTLKGLFWNAIDRFGNQFMVIVAGIITARLLSPADFGLVGVLLIFSTVATAFVDSGLAASMVRSPEVGEKDYSTMFVFNLCVAAFLYVLLFLAAPTIERFNGIAGLALYARVLFLQMPVHALGIVQYVRLVRSFSFKVTARINILATFFSGSLAVGLAVSGFGVWALLLQQPVYSLCRTAMLWLWGSWRPDLSFSWKSLKKHIRFSLSYMAGNMLARIFPQIYYSFIGKHFSAERTGFYLQGNKWGETPNLFISSIVHGTTQATLAPLQNDRPRFLNACRTSMKALAFVLFPAGLCAIAVARSAFAFVLTETWAESVPYFQLLCLGSMLGVLTDMNANFLNIKGKSAYTLWMEGIKLATALAVLWLTYRFGIMAIIYGQLGIRTIFFCAAGFLSGTVYGYAFFRQMLDILPVLCIGMAAFSTALLPLCFLESLHHLPLLLLQVAIFGCVYLAGCHLTKNSVWLELLGLAKSRFSKQKAVSQ